MPMLPELGSSLPDVVLRTAIVYLFVVAAIRISGKREVGQMSVLELVVTLLTLDFAIKWFTGRSRSLRNVIEGEPRLLVRDGRLLDRALREEKIDADELRAAVRAHGLTRLEDVRLAVLETDGAISVIPLDKDAAPPANRPPSDDRSA